MKEIKLGTVNAKFAWMLREHHGWTTLHSAYVSNRAEFGKECDEVVLKAAGDSSDQPSLFDRADFIECFSGEEDQEKITSLKTDTTHILESSGDFEQFSNAETAQKAYDEAMTDHGYSRLTVDRGGHAGETMRTDVSDIDITVYVGNDSLRFTVADLDTEFSAEDVLDKNEDLTGEEVAAVLEIVHTALASFIE